VPPAVADGQRIRVKGKGQPGTGGRGNLMIRCRIAPHPYFVRKDLDISIELPLSISEASLGAKIDVPTLDGVTTLTVPAGTSSGAKLRLRGKGIHDPRAGRTGDMYAVVRVMVPKSVSPRAAELLKQLDDETGFDPRRNSSWGT
jgi:DnaJ-class molecular chaperone